MKVELTLNDMRSPHFSVASLGLPTARLVVVDLTGLFHRQIAFWKWQAPAVPDPIILPNLYTLANAVNQYAPCVQLKVIEPTDKPAKRIIVGGFSLSALLLWFYANYYPYSGKEPIIGSNPFEIIAGVVMSVVAVCIIGASFFVRAGRIVHSEACADFNQQLQHTLYAAKTGQPLTLPPPQSIAFLQRKTVAEYTIEQGDYRVLMHSMGLEGARVPVQ